jgi:hypothetical protein
LKNNQLGLRPHHTLGEKTMRITMHDIETVTVEKDQFNTFAALTLKFKDKSGGEMEITLFTDDLAKLNINTATIKAKEF